MIDAVATLPRLEWLYPAWLWLTLPLLLLAVWLPARPVRDAWQRVLSPRVRAFLIGAEPALKNGTPIPARRQRRINPWLLLAAGVTVAAAGPALESRQGDTLQHGIGWILLADVSRSMTLEDVKPSRLAAMRRQLLAIAEQAGARAVSLILYAGDAFLATPPSIDQTLFRDVAALLEYGIMPLEGSSPARALALADAVIRDSALSGARVFLLSDSGDFNKTAEAAAAHLAAAGHSVDVLLFGSAGTNGQTAVDAGAGARVAAAGNGELLIADSLGRIDLDALVLDQSAGSIRNAALRARYWQNQSHWLLLLLMLPLARLLAGHLPVVVLSSLIATALQGAASGTAFAGGEDVLAHSLYRDGKFAQAAELFTDPAWKGVALYRSEQWWRAADAFVRANDADSAYNLGNCYVRLGYPELALQAYGQALALDPGNSDAAFNAELVRRFLDARDSGQTGDSAMPREQQAIDQLDADDSDDGSGNDTPHGEDADSGERAEGDSESTGDRADTVSDAGTPGSSGAPDERSDTPPPGEGNRDAERGRQGEDADTQHAGSAESGDTRADSAAAGARMQIDGEQATEQWLNRIRHEPRRFLARRIEIELRRRQAAGQEAPGGGSNW